MACRAVTMRGNPHVNLRKNHHSSYRFSNATLPLPHEPSYQKLQNELQRLVQKNLPPVPHSFITDKNMARLYSQSTQENDPMKELLQELRRLNKNLEYLNDNFEKFFNLVNLQKK